MKRILLLQVVVLATFPLWAQRSPRDSRDASPTGMRDQKTPGKSATSSPSADWVKLGQLLNTPSDQLSQEYEKSRQICDVHPNTYAALRLADKQGELDKEPAQVLAEMCKRKTDSFSFALKSKSAPKSNTALTSASGNKSEKDFRKAVQEKLKEK